MCCQLSETTDAVLCCLFKDATFVINTYQINVIDKNLVDRFEINKSIYDCIISIEDFNYLFFDFAYDLLVS